ncbi:pyruvate kinase [Variovorax sp. WS11]|uniref:pyruvate kinase n=1 Tax=Variovorax sp. WS11 TaxID=1105204 RepID=UPI000D0DFC8F|nr:pyruvate kinase [Variovorax sp. WS11]NDZ13384.1 pyruvate kinase [Variovorax sp. WS11]PSL81611.1 pyruvate kinase [Variovorax sp. WS11]
MRRTRRARIVATLGPASSDEAAIRALFERGVDVFRLNFSHGTQSDHARRLETIRALEQEFGRPIGVLLDLQGPKLRLGTFDGGRVQLEAGARFRLDMDRTPGDARRAPLPHLEIFAALQDGTELLLDDGKLRLRVERHGADFAETTVLVGGPISDRKGVNVPSVLLPLSPLTPKDRDDLDFGLALGVDWVALSFVQRPEDIEEARALIGSRAWIMAKLEKPAAIEHLEGIVALSDGIMVARGDLGVELPPEQVPQLQRRIVRACRQAGKPVVVATQMLESMIAAPVPTRAEVSDVATAVYDGVDAVMLSAESASGRYPLEAVAMMDRIIARVEADPSYRSGIDATHAAAQATTADAVCASLRDVAALLSPAATVTYTSSGFTSLRAARERPAVPILSLTPDIVSARRMAMVWGVHAVLVDDVHDVAEMIECACRTARTEGFAHPGDHVVVVAGLPFGQSGTTNLLHVARIPR